jgi:predicted DsbA family dithiol-disulfide isomerase
MSCFEQKERRMAEPLAVTVYSDVICPWCYVGKRRFEAALGGPGVPAEVTFHWLPFELNPDMPDEGITRAEYRTRKFGAERAAELDRNMTETGREVGIAFAFDRMQVTPSTKLAHRLIWEAGRQGRQNEMVNRLFKAYFEEALDIGDADVLATLAAEAGLDAAGAAQALTGQESLDAVTELAYRGRAIGIQGVPFFILLGKYGVSGAQPPEFWREALPKIAAEAEKPAA